MGSSVEEVFGYLSEHPQHSVNISGFWLSQYPITQAQWRVIAKRTELSLFHRLEACSTGFLS